MKRLSSDIRTHHAITRCQQRGVTASMLSLLIDFADCEIPVGGGCTAISLSRRGEEVLHRSGFPPAWVDKVRRLAAVVAPDGCLITVLHPSSRGYRRAWN